jgi:copper transport protein
VTKTSRASFALPLARTVALALAISLVVPALAEGHATLERTEPGRGASLDAAPERVAFYFSEPVEASFGAIRVFDPDGAEIETGELERPGGDSDGIAATLPSDLEDGTYTATYRVVSADSHPVSGGFVFTVGQPGAGPAQTVSELLAGTDAGDVTSVAYWAARWLGYLAIGIGAGTLIFIAAVWRPALRRVVDARGEWRAAADAFAARARLLMGAAAITGLLASLASVVLQGATAAGTSFWAALDPDVISEVLETRFGTLAALRGLAWALVAILLLAPPGRLVPVPQPVRLGATGMALSAPSPMLTLGLALPLGFLLIAPALGGHAANIGPSWLLVPANVVHIAAMSAWFCGLALFALALPSATGKLEPAERSPLLAATLMRFSPLALTAVLVLAATGALQAIAYLSSFSDLLDTAFGRAISIKVALLTVLVGLGAVNRQRLLPGLERVASRRETPGRTGVLLRRTIRAEVALLVAVLGVAAALVSYPPPSEAEAGPVSGSETLGPALLEYTVEPAEAGPNRVHLYLFDAVDGTPLRQTSGVRMNLSLPDREIGPLRAELERAGPGHYIAQGAPFGVAGEWLVEVAMRISRFEEADAEFEVEIQ